MKKIILPVILSSIFIALLKQAYGDDFNLRLTQNDLDGAQVEKILEIVNQKTGQNLTMSDFLLIEERDLATSKYIMLSQSVAGVPIDGKNIRVWSNLKSGNLIQAEIFLDLKTPEEQNLLSKKYSKARISKSALSSKKLAIHVFKMAQAIVKNHPDDSLIMDAKSYDQWKGDDLIRTITIKARRGEHKIDISLLTNSVVNSSYKQFPQADQSQFLSLKALVYPIFEEVESTHEKLSRIESELKYIHTNKALTEADPYSSMRNRRYTEDMYNPLLAETSEGRSAGYWSTPVLKRMAEELVENLPKVSNSFESGVVLDGKYTSINIHPDAVAQYSEINFKPKAGVQFYPTWSFGDAGWEVLPKSGFQGKPIFTEDEALNRTATRDPEHSPVTYINEGFDEVQVYWAVTSFMESLNHMGMSDPELSTRPFHSFLYDPDIGMKDNAYYTSDTINFTTYSPESINYARDNSTIWHELGHGIMDRLMGDHIRLADTGGLSEGMADFLAALVIQDVMKDEVYPGYKDYRIINNTGFFLTNEVHDDGEAYGGSMNDMLKKALEVFGSEDGVDKMTDLTLETMRLTRNHPALTAQEWFSHMLFADSIGSSMRNPGEFKEIIENSLASRNFSWKEEDQKANLNILFDGNELSDSSIGSRENPIRLEMNSDEKVTYKMNVNLESVDHYQFNYPVTVKVEFKTGALQGAVKWENEELNPIIYTLNNEQEVLDFNLSASGTCDAINQPDGSCKDYAYIQIYNNGATKKPVAKKRFYLKIKPLN